MNKYLKILIVIAILLIVGILSDYFATKFSPFPEISIFDPRPVPFDRIGGDRDFYYQGDMELFYKVRTILSSINAALLIFLLISYVDMYSKMKSEFTIGLIVFSMTLLLYALTSNPLLQTIFGYHAFGLGPFAMLPDMFTTIALIVLSYLTMK